MTAPKPEVSDASLLERWSEADPEAGRALTDRYFGLVYRFFSTKAPACPEDLVQQTFLSSVRAAHRFDASRGSFRAFLLGIARNELMQYRRKRARESRAMERAAGGQKQAHSSPSRELAHQQHLGLLLRALRELPVEQQVLIELYYWEELSVAELGQVVGIPPGTIKSRLSKARDQLRDQLAALQLPERDVQDTLDNFERWAAAVRGEAAENKTKKM